MVEATDRRVRPVRCLPLISLRAPRYRLMTERSQSGELAGVLSRRCQALEVGTRPPAPIIRDVSPKTIVRSHLRDRCSIHSPQIGGTIKRYVQSERGSGPWRTA